MKIADIYNKVWHTTKGCIVERVKNYCDGLEPKQRMKVIAIMSGLFLLAAFFAFGHACYRLGQGHAPQSVKVEHIRSLDFPAPDKSKSVIPEKYEYPGLEDED